MYFIVVVQFSSVRYVPVIIDEEEQWRLVCMSHEGVSTTVEANAMSGHFGRDKTISPLTSKVFFPGITSKVKQFVESCEACRHVRVGPNVKRVEMSSNLYMYLLKPGLNLALISSPTYL